MRPAGANVTWAVLAWALLLAGLVGLVVGIVLPLQLVVESATPAVVTTGWSLPPRGVVAAAVGVGSVPVIGEACILLSTRLPLGVSSR